MLSRKRKKERLRKQQKSFPHQLRKRGHLGRKAPSPEKEESSQRGSEGLQADKPVDLS